MKKQFRDFESAREFVRSLGLKNYKEWQEYCKLGKKPEDIPTRPNIVYKNDGYVNFGDWSGTGNVQSQQIQYRSFKKAREFAISLNLKGQKEWQEYCKSGDMPDDIPKSPRTVYKNKGWKNNGDFLGTGNVAPQNMQFRSFTEARAFARKLGLKNKTEWAEYCKSDERPEDIPVNARTVYKKDYKGFGDWLGTGNVKTGDKQFRSYKEAREFVRSLGLKSQKEWLEYCASGNKPDDIPNNPWRTYTRNRVRNE